MVEDITERKAAAETLRLMKRKIRRQNKYLAFLHEISLGMMNRLDVNDLLGEIILQAGELLGTAHGVIYLVDGAQDTYVCKVGLGIYAEDVGRKIKVGEGMVSRVVATGQPMVLNDYNSWPHRLTDPFFRTNIFCRCRCL